MRPDTAVLPPRFLRTKEAAEFLSLSARTLEKHRTYGTGPGLAEDADCGRLIASAR